MLFCWEYVLDQIACTFYKLPKTLWKYHKKYQNRACFSSTFSLLFAYLACIEPLFADSLNMQGKHLSPYSKKDSQGLEKGWKCEVDFVAPLMSRISTDCVPSPDSVDEFRHVQNSTQSFRISLGGKICPLSEPRDYIFNTHQQWFRRRL